MIDLHMHTVNSDGSKTVKEVLQMCEEKKLEYISITDHNTCQAYYDEDYKNNQIFKGKIIVGCEFNANFHGKAIEILGYNLDADKVMEWRKKYCSVERIKENNEKIKNRFLKILDEKKIEYDLNNIRPLKDYKELIERTIWEEIVKHEENKKIIGEEYFNSLGSFYRKEITNPNSDYFLNRVGNFVTAKEIVKLIHSMNGKAFLAHPFEYKFEDTLKVIDELNNEVKLDGIECFHPSAETDNRINTLIEYARKNNLYISGGSDYHGIPKPDIEIAIGRGSLEISKNYVEEWN